MFESDVSRLSVNSLLTLFFTIGGPRSGSGATLQLSDSDDALSPGHTQHGTPQLWSQDGSGRGLVMRDTADNILSSLIDCNNVRLHRILTQY